MQFGEVVNLYMYPEFMFLRCHFCTKEISFLRLCLSWAKFRNEVYVEDTDAPTIHMHPSLYYEDIINSCVRQKRLNYSVEILYV